MSKSTTKAGGAVLLVAAAALAVPATGVLAASDNGASWKTAPPISENYAKSRITGDGYTDVTDLRQTKDGWTAKAKESGNQVDLMVTNFGTVDKT